jgi:hypothetical protein
MGELPHLGPPTVPGAPVGRPSPDMPHGATERRLDRDSRLILQVGVVMSAIFVFVPLVGLAAVLVFLASLETWHGGEGPMTDEVRLTFLSVALLSIGVVVACAVALRHGLRGGWIALVFVGIGGLACIYIGVRGIIAATGVDNLITALSWGVGGTGVVLVLGASLGLTATLRR